MAVKMVPRRAHAMRRMSTRRAHGGGGVRGENVMVMASASGRTAAMGVVGGKKDVVGGRSRVAKVKAAKEFTCEVEKPLGMKLGQKPGDGGGVKVDFVNPGGNASKAGIKAGDTILYTSSWFGDELWPADKLPFVMTSINAKAGGTCVCLSPRVHAHRLIYTRPSVHVVPSCIGADVYTQVILHKFTSLNGSYAGVRWCSNNNLDVTRGRDDVADCG